MIDETKTQTIILYLTDGTKAVFTGPYQIEFDKPVGLRDMKVLEPKDLPDGQSWSLTYSKEGDA